MAGHRGVVCIKWKFGADIWQPRWQFREHHDHADHVADVGRISFRSYRWRSSGVSCDGPLRHTALLFAGVVGAFTPLVTIAALVMLDTPHSGLRLALPLAWGTAGIGCGLLDTSHGVQAATSGGKRVHALGFLAVKGAGAVGAAGVGDWAIAGKVGVGPHLVAGWPPCASAFLLLSSYRVLDIATVQQSSLPGPRCGPGGTVRAWRAGSRGSDPGWRNIYVGYVCPVSAGSIRVAGGQRSRGPVGHPGGEPVRVLALVGSGYRSPIGEGLWRDRRFGTVVLAGVAVLSSGGHGSAPARDVGIAVAGIALIGVGVAQVPVLVQRAASMVRTGRLGLTTRVSVVVTVQYTCQGAALLAVGLLGQITGVVISLTVVCGLCIAALPLGVQIIRRACSIPLPAEVTG